MKKIHIALIVILSVLLLFFLIRFFSQEDSWIKDEKGQYIKHGNPSETPDYVLEQQNAIAAALQLYEQNKEQDMNFSSQCLGTAGDYAIDIVHAPRTSEDNLVENQCADFRNGSVSHFIELDNDGSIVRIV